MDESHIRQIIDEEHLKLLRWGYFLSAGWTALFSLFGVAYGAMGVLISSLPVKSGTEAGAEAAAWIFGLFGFGFALASLGIAVSKLMVAKALRVRRSRTLCLVVAAITCLGFPDGTFLGVCTFLVLGRASVRDMFEGDKKGSAHPVLG